jgi:hypothetical protein
LHNKINQHFTKNKLPILTCKEAPTGAYKWPGFENLPKTHTMIIDKLNRTITINQENDDFITTSDEEEIILSASDSTDNENELEAREKLGNY